MDRKQLKISLLKEILQKKKILFGAFSPTLSRDIKNEAWKEVHASSLALGLVSATKDYAYTRDVLWQNIKKAAMKKRDNSRQTGSGGGTKLNQIDEFVFEIIGKESPVLDGLEVLESPSPNEMPTPCNSSSLQSSQLPANEPASQPSCSTASKLHKPKPKPLPNKKFKNLKIQKLKTKKILLIIKYLELKILKLQRELSVNDNAQNTHSEEQQNTELFNNASLTEDHEQYTFQEYLESDFDMDDE